MSEAQNGGNVMERLTQRLRTGEVLMASDYEEKFTEQEWIDVLQNRLAAYEETWLTPEEIDMDHEAAETLRQLCRDYDLDRLEKLAEADRDGRVVVLPCKTVFELTWDAGPDCDLICPVSIDGNGCCDFCDKGKLFAYERPCCQEHIKQLGKTVFLTREEAAKALEAMKDE